MSFYLDSIFYSYAQIFFSNRRWFGIAALLITMIDPQVGLLGLMGVTIANGLAIYLNFDREKIQKGFYGFNPILIAAAIGFFFELTPFLFGIIIVFILLTFFISAALEHLMANVFNLPGLSLPFILSLHIFLLFISNFNTVFYKEITFLTSNTIAFIPEYINVLLKSFALILLQSSSIAGLAFLVIVLFFSRVMFINTLFAFAVNFLIVHLLFQNVSESFLILTSFNAILTAFALGGSMIIISKKTIPLLFITLLFNIIITVFFENLLSERMLPVLVLPFNFVVLSTIYSLKFRKENTDLTLLYFNPGSPEENYYYHQNRITRFEGFKYLFPELPFWGEWKVSQGFNGKHTHKRDWKYAWDFIIDGDNGKDYENDGDVCEDYFCFDTPVIAPLDGTVVKVIDNINDNKIGEVNTKQNWGNTIVIDHGQGLFSALSHLKKKSITISENDKIKKGDIIAKCGNSGRSPYPHLHFQFQLTDRIGEKTYKFPFSHFVFRNNGDLGMRSFTFPEEGTYVRNIETHKVIRKAFDFKLGDEYTLKYSLNGKSGKEHWEVKIDIFNHMYIENDDGAKLYIYLSDKVFYSTNYVGKKDSVLYFFYLNVISVPFGYYEKLNWYDKYPISITVKSFVRYLSEFILLFSQQITSEAVLNWVELEDQKFKLNYDLENKGKGLFSFFTEKTNGQLYISAEGDLKSLEIDNNKIKFNAALIKNENEENNEQTK